MTDFENQNRSFFMLVLLKSTLTSECAYEHRTRLFRQPL
ncbi:hypothetical protein CJ739_2893 [Mariniflexile rhizosphaerae]|nr:hypothetical protein CJ739_2893 [Mariniflexile sp. TRM1-10]